MLPVEVYYGFYPPWVHNEGRWSAAGIFGHCEAWFYTEDQTWTFIDPQRTGMRIYVTHLHDEVEALLAARFTVCQSILRIRYQEPKLWAPTLGPQTCASVCGAVVGVRALLPATLRRRLLRKGAEIIHDPERRSEGQGGETAGAASVGD